MVSCLLANHGFVYLEAPFIVQMLPAMLAAARGAVFNGIPPYDLWEHPPAVGKIPPHGSDAGSYLDGELFGARSIILIRDVDGLYSSDPKTNSDAKFISEISAVQLIRMQLATLPIDPVVLGLLPCRRGTEEISEGVAGCSGARIESATIAISLTLPSEGTSMRSQLCRRAAGSCAMER